MNIIGEGFPEEIIKQVKQRQKVYGSGYTENRNPEEIVYLNANTSWVKLVSSVDIENNKILQDESLRGIVNKGSSLAKQFVLFNGTNQNPQNQRSGIATNGDLLGNNNVYGIGGTEFGIRPMMGIQSAEIKHENRGSIRRATVKIKAYNRTQFDIIDALYLRLGFSVLLEWGHSMYYDNNGVLQTNPQNSLADDFLKGKTTYDKFLNKIQQQRLISQGNYDAMFAKVTNIHWSFLPDGSYDITLDLVSIGDIIESFKINSLTNSTIFDNVLSSAITPRNIVEDQLFKLISSTTIGKFFLAIRQKMGANPTYVFTKEDQFGFTTEKIDVISINYKEDIGLQYYIRLGTFLQFLQDQIIYQATVGTESTPILKFDFDTDSNLIYIEKGLQVSIDPQICVVNRTLTFSGFNPFTFAPNGEVFDSPLFSDLETPYGQIMNIYVNGVWILLKLEELKNPDNNKVVLIDFLNSILSSINNSLGGTTKLESNIDETTNSIIIRDANPLPNLDQVISKLNNTKKYNIPNKYADFNLFRYNGDSASFIKNFSFTTEISPELSTMLTIGATANSTVVGENATAFSKFNAGLKDRFKEQIVQSKKEIYQNKYDTFLELYKNKNKLSDEFKQTYTDYILYLKKLSEETYVKDTADRYRDVLTNLITYQQQIRQVALNIKYEKQNKIPPSLFAPGTGFIPFNLSLTMDGLSGMKIYSKFFIDVEFLPANYPDNAEFLIKNIVHKIENNKWTTQLESIVISKGTTNEGFEKIQNNSNAGTLSQSSQPTSISVGNTNATKGNPSLKQVIINAGYPEGTKEYIFAYSIGVKEGWLSTSNGGKGSRSYRNNNPGNLDFSNNLRKIDPGVTLENNPYGSNRFAHFTTAELGAKALVEAKIKRWGNGDMPATEGNGILIEQKKGGFKYKNGTLPTIAQFVYTYAPPNENNTELYISNLLADLKKVKPNTTRTTLVKQFFA